MPTNRETFPIQFNGGLISNMSPLQQGLQMPGSARILRNFEPSIEGGYKRILGYDKYDLDIIPPYGIPVVHGASQTGTTLNIANIRQTPEQNDKFKLVHVTANINGTSTIASANGPTALVNGAITADKTIIVDTVASGTIAKGQTLTGVGIPSNITVSSVTAGAAGNFTVVLSSNVTVADNLSLQFTFKTTTFAVDGVVGTIQTGMEIVGKGIPRGTTVQAFSSPNVTIGSAADTLSLTLADDTALEFKTEYTIGASITFDDDDNRATIGISPALTASPANGDEVEFTSTTTNHRTIGCGVFLDSVIVARNESLIKTTGTGFTLVNVPVYGTVLVNGASQTGSSLIIDGLTSTPQIGDVFKIAGVDKIYTVTATPTVSSGGTTVAIDPALASSPADNAALTFLSTSRENGGKTRFSRYNYTGTEKVAIVDGVNVPALYNGSQFTALNDAPTDVAAAEFVVNFKSHLVFGKSNVLTFTAPFTDTDFTAANGSGTISVGSAITGLIVFRQQLIIFTESSIFQITGNTIADFQLQPVTTDIGCVDKDTIQEVGGDIMFLGPDGLRLLSATDRFNDFNLAVVSKTVQKEVTDFITANTSFTSVVIRNKSQYRILGFNNNIGQANAQGILGTQMAGQGGEGMSWADLRGIRAYVADSRFYQNAETIVFANDDGYLYQMEEGNSFDGSNIQTTFATPYMPINDPRIRKTFYKMFLYTDPQGSVSFDVSLKLDFDQKNSVQPTKIDFNNATGTVAFMGQATYGSTAVYSSKLKTLFETQIIGSAFVVSLQYTSDSVDPPFSLDAITLEYTTNTRR
jgi:hypothetical protein